MSQVFKRSPAQQYQLHSIWTSFYLNIESRVLMQHYRATVPGVPPTTNSSCSDSGNLHLNYSLHDRKKSIAIVWSTLLTITCIQVEVLYFSLRYGANKTEADALEIPTAILLALSVLSILYRTWQLMWRSSKCRPSGAKWWEVSQTCSVVCTC